MRLLLVTIVNSPDVLTHMTPGRFRQIRGVFESASQLPAESRKAHVLGLCGEDERLFAEVERMIEAAENPHGPLDRPALEITGVTNVSGTPLVPGQRLGPYSVDREIGRGGMGTVYVAHRADGAFQRKVAIKIARYDLGHPEVRRRFQQEREILAGLDHPNIARLLDAGTTHSGLPYFLMEYVDGKAIDQYCDSQRLSLRARLKLFSAVCEAVEYAHRHHVIHRDLKPQNILVTEGGVVKLLDFGIAKLVDSEKDGPTQLVTQTGLHLMTPEYASPEQVHGKTVTTATDVYALGIILFELLTGEKPYRSRARMLHKLMQAIYKQEPLAQSTVVGGREVARGRAGTPDRLKGLLSGNLVDVILKALDKDPTGRYASPKAFCDDLQSAVRQSNRPSPRGASSLGLGVEMTVDPKSACVARGVALNDLQSC